MTLFVERERERERELSDNIYFYFISVPPVVSVCCDFIESHGIVDGVYRLSGITSNIQRLKKSFDEDKLPDLAADRQVLQDIHSVSSLVKLYFRELPAPVCTFQLYDQFVSAVKSAEEVRILKASIAFLPRLAPVIRSRCWHSIWKGKNEDEQGLEDEDGPCEKTPKHQGGTRHCRTEPAIQYM